MKRTLQCLALTVCITASVSTCKAQSVPRYSPQRPTVSPYLNLLRNNRGPLPNYYSFVRPQLNQQAFDRQMASTARSQGIAVQRLSTLASGSQRRMTGVGGGYNDYSHYYRMPARSRGRR